MLKKPVSVFTSTGKTKPPYTLSLLWKPKNFPARGPFSIRTILNQNGVRELPSSAAYDTQREKVSVPFSRRTFSSVSIIVPNAEEGDKTLVDEMVHPPETSSPHSHVQREAPVQEPAETEINSRSPQSNVEEPAQKPHEVVPRPNPVAQDVVNCEVSTQHDDIAPRKRGRPRSKPHPPQKAQSPPFQLVRPKRTRAPKPVYKDTMRIWMIIAGWSDVSERKDAEEMGEKFSDADDADQRHDKPTRKSTQRLQEDDNEAMETVKRRARKPAIHAHEDDEDGIEFNKPHTLRLTSSDDEEELEVDGPCRQRVDNEHICKPAKHADDDDEKDTTIPKPRSNRRVNQQRLGKSTKHLYKEDEGPMEVDKKRHSDDQRSRKEMKTLHQDLSDESEEMEVDRYPHHRRVGGDRARKPAKLLHEDDEDIQVDTRVRKSVKRVFEVDEEIESLMEHQPRELCEHIPDRDKLKNPPRSTRTSAFGEKDNVLSLYSAPRSTHHESIPISSPAADRATFCTFKDDEIAAVEGVFDGMKKVFLAQVHHKRTQAITSHLTHLSKRQKTHLELLHETVPVWRMEFGTEDERGMSMEVVDEVLKKHEVLSIDSMTMFTDGLVAGVSESYRGYAVLPD
ncbi:hypothetical protein BC829DRAFT_434468 [Chytridium lagenaria]|nr:hypothetical protein BC829DRAFT_434468 [Chytridium lagenaria]